MASIGLKSGLMDWPRPILSSVVDLCGDVLLSLVDSLFCTSGPLVTPLAVVEKKRYNGEEEMCCSFSSEREKHVSPPKSSPAPLERARTDPVRTAEPFPDDACRSSDPCQRSACCGRRSPLYRGCQACRTKKR